MQGKKTTILVADDEPQVLKMLGILLDVENFKIVEAQNGRQAVRLCASVKPDIMLLDLRMPDIDGKEVITAVREWSQVPIVVLSACAADEEISAALNLGANDYVTKPFNIEVLLARIHASLRCGTVREIGECELRNGALRMDLMRHEVFLHDRLTAFTPKEYDLLRYFMVHRGKMLTHREILKAVWGAAHGEDTAYLRVYTGQLRAKIEADPAHPTFITTEPGIGYRMEVLPPVPVPA